MATKSCQKLKDFLSLFIFQFFEKKDEKLISYKIYWLHLYKFLKRHTYKLYVGYYKMSEVV